MKTPITLSLFLCFHCVGSLLAQEELASAEMKVKEYASTVVLPIIDKNKNIHIFGISDNAPSNKDVAHITYSTETTALTQTYYEKPKDVPFKQAVGIDVDASNTINIYFHNKGKGEFHSMVLDQEGNLGHQSFELKTKKEKVIQYLSVDNAFLMLTVSRNQSVLNLYEITGNTYEKTTFDLSGERFYSKDSKLVTLSDILGKASISSVTSELSNRAKDFGERIKIYPQKGTIIITLNNNDNGTRIITLDRQSNTASADYIPMPTKEFAEGAESSIKTNSFLFEDKIFSLIVSTKLLVIDIKNRDSKEVLKVLKFSPDQKISLVQSRSSVLPIGPISIATNNTKQKEKNAKKFFRDMKYAIYSGLFVQPFDAGLLMKIGGHTPPTSAVSTMGGPGTLSAGTDAFGNVTIASTAPVGTSSTGYSTSYGFETFTLLDSNSYDAMDNGTYPDIYDKANALTEDQKGIQLETLLKYEDYFIYGFYNKKEDRYRLVKIQP
ncbi:MAG: hypothetical protein AAGH81_01275 [Bacteroidota bacterium]